MKSFKYKYYYLLVFTVLLACKKNNLLTNSHPYSLAFSSICTNCVLKGSDSNGRFKNEAIDVTYEKIENINDTEEDLLDYYQKTFKSVYYMKFFDSIYIDQKVQKLMRDSIEIIDFQFIEPSRKNSCKICNVKTTILFRGAPINHYTHFTKELIEEFDKKGKFTIKNGYHYRFLKDNNTLIISSLNPEKKIHLKCVSKAGFKPFID